MTTLTLLSIPSSEPADLCYISLSCCHRCLTSMVEYIGDDEVVSEDFILQLEYKLWYFRLRLEL